MSRFLLLLDELQGNMDHRLPLEDSTRSIVVEVSLVMEVCATQGHDLLQTMHKEMPTLQMTTDMPLLQDQVQPQKNHEHTTAVLLQEILMMTERRPDDPRLAMSKYQIVVFLVEDSVSCLELVTILDTQEWKLPFELLRLQAISRRQML